MADKPDELSAMMVRMDSGHEQLKHTAAEMHGIDNSWNLLHIASGVLPALIAPSSPPRLTPHEAAIEALRYADALLKEWRKSQGDDYGD